MKSGIALSLLPLFLLGLAQANEIRVAASDLLASYIKDPMLAFSEERDIIFKISEIGSLPALDRLRSDEIDLAIIAVPENAEVPHGEFNIYPFAYDAPVVVVNESNPINEISVSHLGGIFGANEEFSFNTWGDLGVPGWGSRNIKPLAGTSGESIALELFKFSVFKGGTIKPSVPMIKPEEIVTTVRSDAAAIAILSQIPEKGKVKVLMVSSSKSGDQYSPAFGPTVDNVHYGDYPIRLAFYIAYERRDHEKLSGLIRLLLSDDIAKFLRQNSLFPLPENVRKKLLADLDVE